ncbi:hypothetical protein BD311DRAFT_688848 [Dichomitus squalens]|uniref:RRM domain-containing protein n=1 Tax=Dichomitus squalens TaxID=114155 RepID=A0A4Q9MTV1_9APHY|nr:hypothetical protein BD311DRAFT_688848 [Dichomitus squalens]
MSSSPAQTQLSPARSPSLSIAFPRSPRDTPATPPTSSSCSPHAPPTPPDSSSRIASLFNTSPSPRSNSSLNTSSDFSLSTTLSTSAPQFQPRLIDTPIDLHCLAPDLDSPPAAQDSGPIGTRNDSVNFKAREQGSPTPTQEAMAHRLSPDSLPPAFVPAAAARAQVAREATEDEQTDSSDSDPRPPNVYINGLPPNFPEEELLAMTRPFGPVLSVRTFTRHVSDKPSGYGFVLFERLSSAEKCIESLRKYRNLHPSFSKQLHKIPGTPYASVPPSLTANTGPTDSFKAKMEQLCDKSSTNLYMEGLPLDVTEATLHALVTPYRIMSSRFFHTRLSSPPRIIAFVRLETRTAAEDIIERLHGRLVRGWNDAGCRISVRFADTAEQRELRRNERQNPEGEQSPARLTMARAALLNLKGTQYQGPGLSPTLSDVDLGSLQNTTNSNLGLAYNQFGLGQAGQISPIGPTSPLPAQDAFLRGGIGLQETSALGVNMPSLDTFSTRNPYVSAQTLRLPHQDLPADASGLFDEQAELQLALMNMQGARAQSGYTPVEQLILQAHVRQRRAHAAAPHHDSVPARAPNPRSGHPRVGRSANSGYGANRRLLDFLPPVSEDDFHATAALVPNHRTLSQAMPGEIGLDAFSRGGDLSCSTRALDLERQVPLSGQPTRQRVHTLAAQVRPDVDSQGLHIRSSTLPTQYLNVRNTTRPSNINNPLYDSSISLAGNVSSSSSRRTSNVVRVNETHVSSTQQSSYSPSNGLTTTRNARTLGASALADTQTLFTSKNNVNISSAASRKSTMTDADVKTSSPPSTSIIKPPNGATSGSTSHPGGVSMSTSTSQDADDEDEGSCVVSPALTYSSRTPASLSPATPYSGFFSENGETFKNAGINVSGTIGPVGPGDVQPDMSEVKKVQVQGGNH